MSELWTISVDGRIYGPYSLEQMRAFAGEGRLAPTSLVARPGEENFRDVSEVPELAALFRANRPQALAEVMEDPAPSFGREAPAEHAGEMAHIVIMADMKSRSLTGLEEEIFNLGPAYTILPQAWVVKSSLPVSIIRNQLIQKLGKLDQLFIIDATNDRALWFNFGPEADTKLRRLWSKTDNLKRAG